MNEATIISKMQLDEFRESVALFDDSKVHFKMGRSTISLCFRYTFIPNVFGVMR